MADTFVVGGSSGRYWNFTQQDKDDYTLGIEGTVVEIILEQRIDFMSKKPLVWADSGRPQLRWRFVIKTVEGDEIMWPFNQYGTGERAVQHALTNGQMGRCVFDNMLGKYIRVMTDNDRNNWVATKSGAKARPYTVQIIGDGDASAVRGCTDNSHKQLEPEPQQAPAPQPQPVQQNPALQAAQQRAQQAVQQNNGYYPVAPVPQPQPVQAPAGDPYDDIPW